MLAILHAADVPFHSKITEDIGSSICIHFISPGERCTAGTGGIRCIPLERTGNTPEGGSSIPAGTFSEFFR
jgi:hypothetical protein